MLKEATTSRIAAGLSHMDYGTVMSDVATPAFSNSALLHAPMTFWMFTFSVQSSLQETMRLPPLSKAAPHTVDV